MWLRPPQRRRKPRVGCARSHRERGHAPVRPCPRGIACGLCGRIGADGDARQRERPLQLQSVADGVLRLDTRTGQVSQCSRSDGGWACKLVPDERSALETKVARLQSEIVTLKKELLTHGLPLPGVSSDSAPETGKPELKLPSDAEVDKVMSFVEKVWRRLIEMGRTVQKDAEKKD
jgi:hypothetical protein